MNKGLELLEAIDERGEIGFLDAAAQPQGAAANENLLAVRLGGGETIFVPAERMKAISSDKFSFAGSFQDVPRRAAQIPIGDDQIDSNQTNASNKI